MTTRDMGALPPALRGKASPGGIWKEKKHGAQHA